MNSSTEPSNESVFDDNDNDGSLAHDGEEEKPPARPDRATLQSLIRKKLKEKKALRLKAGLLEEKRNCLDAREKRLQEDLRVAKNRLAQLLSIQTRIPEQEDSIAEDSLVSSEHNASSIPATAAAAAASATPDKIPIKSFEPLFDENSPLSSLESPAVKTQMSSPAQGYPFTPPTPPGTVGVSPLEEGYSVEIERVSPFCPSSRSEEGTPAKSVKIEADKHSIVSKTSSVQSLHLVKKIDSTWDDENGNAWIRINYKDGAAEDKMLKNAIEGDRMIDLIGNYSDEAGDLFGEKNSSWGRLKGAFDQCKREMGDGDDESEFVPEEDDE